MKTVLVIAHAFPPAAGMGTVRICRFLKYLPQYGWKAHVLTIASVAPGVPLDDTMMGYVPPGTSISRVTGTDLEAVCGRLERWHLGRLAYLLNRLVGKLPPDRWLLLWLPQAYREARRILTKNPIDAIFTSSFPCTAHLVGYLLKKTTGKPWVGDFRDEWSQHPHRSWPKTWQRQIDAWLERQVLLKADKVVAATDAYVAGLAALSPSEKRDKFTTITNGFDAENFADGPSVPNDRFVIAHVGFLYDGFSFLTAMEELLAERKIPNDKVQLMIVGKIEPLRFAPYRLEDYPLTGQIMQYTGWVPHTEAVQCMKSATMLLITLGRHRGTATIPGKTFEYIATDRPILAVVPPEGEAAKVIRKTNSGMVVAPEDRSAIKEAVLSMYARWKSGNLSVRPDRVTIQEYDARELSHKLAQVLDTVSGQGARGEAMVLKLKSTIRPILRLLGYYVAREIAEERWQDWKTIRDWKKSGKPLPPPHRVKQIIIRKYAKAFSLRVFVETGTYLGSTVYATRNKFERIFSIELDRELFQKASERFCPLRHISIMQGDSGEILPDILAGLRQPCLFWLDAHYTDEKSARGKLETPIMQELHAIFGHSITEHVILIDDAHAFVGKNDYPTLGEVQELVFKEHPDWFFEVKNDIIRIHKKVTGFEPEF